MSKYLQNATMSDKEFLFPYLVNHQTLNTVKSEDYQGDKILIQDTSDLTVFLIFIKIRKEFSKANLKPLVKKADTNLFFL